MLAPAEEDVEVEVRREDQEKIVKFGSLNHTKYALQVELKALNQKVDDLGNAEQEMMFADEDDEAIKMLVGESFVAVDEEYATTFLEAETAKTEAEVARVKTALAEVLQEQQALKDILYARFGKSINLEE